SKIGFESRFACFQKFSSPDLSPCGERKQWLCFAKLPTEPLMTVLSRLEQRLGFLSIEHLPIYIVSAQSILYLWCFLNPSQAHLLLLDPTAVRYGGEYWRVLTFLFVTPLQNPLFAFFFLYLLYIYGSALENTWGSFPFTLFY